MRRLILILVGLLVLSACSEEQQLLVDGGAEPATTPVADAEGPDDDAGEDEPAISEAPVKATTTTTDVPEAEVVRLAVEDVLLEDDALGLPWEFQHRTFDVINYDAGPQQSNCSDYWLIEQMGSRAAARAMWWRDGANLVHEVMALDDSDEADALMDGARRLADSCPVVSWGEGGDYELHAVDLGVAVSGVETVAVRVDEGNDQQTWRVISIRENLVSALVIPTWPPFDGVPVEFKEVVYAATLTAERLASAGPERAAPATTTSTTIAKTEPVELPTTTVPAPTTTDNPVVKTKPDYDLPDDLVEMLLDERDLDTDWLVGSPSEYQSATTSAAELDACPQMAAFDAIDAILAVERTSGVVDVDDLAQIIGRASDAATAVQLVEDFTTVEVCLRQNFETEFNEAAEGSDAILLTEFSLTIESVDVVGADAGTQLEVEVNGERVALVLLAVDDVVTVLTFEEQALSKGDRSLDIAARAVVKIAAVTE